MTFIKEELECIKTLLVANRDNFKKEIFLLLYGEERDSALELSNWVEGSSFGSNAFKNAMDTAIKNYNSSKTFAKLNATIYQDILINADLSKNLNELMESLKILLENISKTTKKQIVFMHEKKRVKSVSINIVGYTEKWC